MYRSHFDFIDKCVIDGTEKGFIHTEKKTYLSKHEALRYLNGDNLGKMG